MDPITTAVVAGLAKLSEGAIQDAYQGLKTLIQARFGREGGLARAVDQLEAKPESAARQAVLQEEVAEARAADDAALLAAARALLQRVEAQAPAQQQVRQTVTGDRNVFSGSGDVSVVFGPTDG